MASLTQAHTSTHTQVLLHILSFPYVKDSAFPTLRKNVVTMNVSQSSLWLRHTTVTFADVGERGVIFSPD